jgi:glycosyltransferase involved in cell wall biosynthesis
MFSIIIPTYNAGDSVAGTLQSIGDQSWRDHEIIVVDNCSTDNTREVVEAFRKSTQCQVQFVSSPDQGIYDAQNKGIDLAKHPWLLFLGAGDRLHNPGVLASVAKKTGLQADIIYGNVLKYRGNKPAQGKTQFPPTEVSKSTLLRSRGICQQAIIANKNVFRVARFSGRYRIAGDFDWLLACAEHKMHFLYMDETVSDYGIDGISGSNVSRLHAELKSIVRRHYPAPMALCYSVFLDISHLKYKLKTILINE